MVKNRLGDLVDVRLTARTLARRRELNADSELGKCDRRNRDVVVIADQLVEVGPASFPSKESRHLQAVASPGMCSNRPHTAQTAT